MTENDEQTAIARWNGSCEAFQICMRQVVRKLITTNSKPALSRYGDFGYGDHYDDYMDRIDAAIDRLERSKILLREAEKARNKIMSYNAKAQLPPERP